MGYLCSIILTLYLKTCVQSLSSMLNCMCVQNHICVSSFLKHTLADCEGLSNTAYTCTWQTGKHGDDAVLELQQVREEDEAQQVQQAPHLQLLCLFSEQVQQLQESQTLTEKQSLAQPSDDGHLLGYQEINRMVGYKEFDRTTRCCVD
jgi:hypothetical protein